MLSFLADIFQFPLLAIDLARRSSGFSADAFALAGTSPTAQAAAVIIAFLAGVSEMLGQSVILVVNRVALYRFIASLLFTGATYVLTALTWTACALAIAPLIRLDALSIHDAGAVFAVVSLAFAPRLLGVFSIAPYIGVAIGNVLEAWAMTLAMFGLMTAFDLPLEAAVFCGGAGWAVSYGLRSFAGHALATPLSHIRVFVTGSTLDKTPQQIIDDVMRAIRGETAS
ncbi:MAG: hypothetical protein ACX939_05085 [Hyphococcus sp.]